jgi:hypothetical protein
VSRLELGIRLIIAIAAGLAAQSFIHARTEVSQFLAGFLVEVIALLFFMCAPRPKRKKKGKR